MLQYSDIQLEVTNVRNGPKLPDDELDFKLKHSLKMTWHHKTK